MNSMVFFVTEGTASAFDISLWSHFIFGFAVGLGLGLGVDVGSIVGVGFIVCSVVNTEVWAKTGENVLSGEVVFEGVIVPWQELKATARVNAPNTLLVLVGKRCSLDIYNLGIILL
jgi:hypothetical protein